MKTPCFDLQNLFFSDKPSEKALAKAICAECPVTEWCASEAVLANAKTGIWSGRDFSDGRQRTAARATLRAKLAG